MSDTPFGTNIRLTIGDEQAPLKDFSFAFKGPKQIDEIDVTTSIMTSTVEIKGEVTMTPEQQEELAQWWAEQWEREFMRQLLGEPSEYEHSLRAAGAKV